MIFSQFLFYNRNNRYSTRIDKLLQQKSVKFHISRLHQNCCQIFVHFFVLILLFKMWFLIFWKLALNFNWLFFLTLALDLSSISQCGPLTKKVGDPWLKTLRVDGKIDVLSNVCERETLLHFTWQVKHHMLTELN